MRKVCLIKSACAQIFCGHIFLAVVVSLLTLSASAQVTLVSWDVNAQNAVSSATLAGSLAANISDGSLSLGTGVSASSATGTFGASGFNQTTLASAITANDYISFTITPAAGYAISISSISYLVGKSSGSTSFSAVLTSDKTGFNAAAALDTYSFSSASPTVRSITLTSTSVLQSITAATEFRIYGVSSNTDTFRVRDNSGVDLSINGTVSAIPEPSSYAVVTVSAILVAAALKRRRPIK